MNHSDKYELIFFHYPKCAGKTIANAIGIDTNHKDNIDSGLRQTILLGFDISFWTHRSDVKKWNNYRKFTVIRNPWDRIVSLYFFRKQENDLYMHFGRGFETNAKGGDTVGPDGKEWGFKRWLLSSFAKGFTPQKKQDGNNERVLSISDMSLDEALSYDSKTLDEAIEQHRFFTDENNYVKLCLSKTKFDVLTHDGDPTTTTWKAYVRERSEWFNQIDVISDVNGNPYIEYALRFENLEEDWNILFKKIGRKPPRLSKKNVSKHTHYSEYYDDETREFVRHLFKKDIEEFGYNFETNGNK
tara:strand:+ start:172 stop:1071 length:900 start_codon:yes stop_codon:yes gene_type:complete